VTGCHRGPKQELCAAGYKVPSLQCTSFPEHLHYSTCVIFHRRVWYHAFSLRYGAMRVFEVRPLSACSRLPLCQISFLSQPPLLN